MINDHESVHDQLGSRSTSGPVVDHVQHWTDGAMSSRACIKYIFARGAAAGFLMILKKFIPFNNNEKSSAKMIMDF
jgi:hypothetical protein